MRRVAYCEKCGTKLRLYNKALPEYRAIITIVEHHECPDTPVEIDLEPVKNVPLKEDGEFVQKLNNLRDRRFDKDDQPVKSTAPPKITEMIETMENTIPERNLE